MKKIKSHFSYSKSQRNGIFLLVVLVFALQGFILYGKFGKQELYLLDETSLKLQIKLDSLERVAYQPKKIYPFNPNYLSDYRAYQLGMSVDEIDRLLAYRKQNKYVNSSKEFQNITKVSDSLLSRLSPLFKFPDWVKKKSDQPKKSAKKIKKKRVVKDINKATIEELVKINGIAEKRAQTILKYRDLLGGFTVDAQLDEVWGIPPDVLVALKQEFKVLSPPKIKPIDVNYASIEELKSIVYINYKQAKSIVMYRSKVGEIQNLAELKTLSDFPVDKYELISLYLHAH